MLAAALQTVIYGGDGLVLPHVKKITRALGVKNLRKGPKYYVDSEKLPTLRKHVKTEFGTVYAGDEKYDRRKGRTDYVSHMGKKGKGQRMFINVAPSGNERYIKIGLDTRRIRAPRKKKPSAGMKALSPRF